MSRRVLTLVIFIFAASACAPLAQAQRGRGGHAFVRVHRGGRFYGASAFWPDYYSDYEEPASSEALPPEMILVAQPMPPAPQPTPPADSLVLELQGDHWVRISSGGATPSTSETALSVGGRTEVPAPTVQLPPAVLVFRDGHQEEIARYTIVGSTIVANSDFWTTGAWTHKIQIADLNVPETLRLNQQRGAQFKLPSGPNEVIVRP